VHRDFLITLPDGEEQIYEVRGDDDGRRYDDE
jgi:hypothetical protein